MQCVELALQNDWFVELWSWRRNLSAAVEELRVRYRDTLSVRVLDEVAFELIVPSFT